VRGISFYLSLSSSRRGGRIESRNPGRCAARGRQWGVGFLGSRARARLLQSSRRRRRRGGAGCYAADLRVALLLGAPLRRLRRVRLAPSCTLSLSLSRAHYAGLRVE
jgi:hypothetical protein